MHDVCVPESRRAILGQQLAVLTAGPDPRNGPVGIRSAPSLGDHGGGVQPDSSVFARPLTLPSACPNMAAPSVEHPDLVALLVRHDDAAVLQPDAAFYVAEQVFVGVIQRAHAHQRLVGEHQFRLAGGIGLHDGLRNDYCRNVGDVAGQDEQGQECG